MKKKIILLLLPLLVSCQGGESYSESNSESVSPSLPVQEEKVTQELLDSLSHNLYLQGRATYIHDDSDYQDEDYTGELSVCFNEKSYFSEESLSNGSYYQTKVIQRNGLPYTYYVDKNNELSYVRVEDSFHVYTWEDFINPFTFLTPENFKETSVDNQFMLSNKTLINKASKLITGYSFEFTSFKITLENNELKEISLKCKGQDSYLYPMTFEFTYDVIDLTKENPSPSVYERKAEHDLLDQAFQNTLNTKNFTIEHLDHHDTYGDTIYHYYFTENAIYCDREETQEVTPFGYVLLDDGLYKFTNTKQDGLVREYKIANRTLEDFYPNYLGFNSTIINVVDPNTFESYDNDNASIIGEFVAESNEEYITAKSSQTLDIHLKDSKVDFIHYFYSILGGFTYGDVTMTYKDYGTTEISLDFSNMKDRSEIPEE